MKDFQLYTKGFEHWHILWQMVVKPFDMCVTLKHMYIYIYIYMNYLSVYLWWCTVWLYVHVDIDRSLNKYGIVCHCNQFSLILSLLLKVKSYALMNGLKAEYCMLKTFFNENQSLKSTIEILDGLNQINNWICKYKIIQKIFTKF